MSTGHLTSHLCAPQPQPPQAPSLIEEAVPVRGRTAWGLLAELGPEEKGLRLQGGGSW